MLRPDPELDIEAFRFCDGQGLGCFLLGRDDDLRFLAPGMNLPGSTGLVIAWPAHRFTVTLATNGLGGERLQLELLKAIAAACDIDLGLHI
jgi:hypothetical protein